MSTQLLLTDEQRLEIEHAVQSGEALPADWYFSPEIFAIEKKAIFERTWQYVGPVAHVGAPGDFYTVAVSDVPVVIARGEDGTLHGMVNVCRHRGCEVVAGRTGNRKSLQCRYHGWTYGLDGSLKAAPRSSSQQGFDKAKYGLFPVSVAAWGPFLFVNLEAFRTDLSDYVGVLPGIVSDARVDVDQLVYRRQVEYDVAANWKVVVENYLECYHCAINHPGLSGSIILDQFHVTTHDNVIAEWAVMRPEYQAQGENATDPSFNYLWPTLILNAFAGTHPSAFARRIIPVSPDRTLVHYDLYFAEEISEQEAEQTFLFADEVFREDIPLVESVQRGLSSGRFREQRLFLTEENGPQHFQQLVYEALQA